MENGVAPRTVASQITSGGVVTRTPPLCLSLQTALHNGSEIADVAADFNCGSHHETRDQACDSVHVK